MIRIHTIEPGELFDELKEKEERLKEERKSILRTFIEEVGISNLLQEVAEVVREDNGLNNVRMQDVTTEGDYEMLYAVEQIECTADILRDSFSL